MRSRSLLWSFNYAIDGIVYALRTQRNMRLHLAAGAVVLVAAQFFRLTALEFAMLLFSIALVFVAELLNTAIEAAVDLATETLDPKAKIAKDVAAGAVFVSAVQSVVIGYLVLFEHLTSTGERVFVLVERAPVHLTVVALALTSFGVLAAKAFGREGTYLRGGWPSGHTAIAFVAATAIGYASGSAAIAVLAVFLAALVAQSRLEAEVHTVPQILVGALLGFLVATLVFQGFPQLFRIFLR